MKYYERWPKFEISGAVV